MWGLMPDFYYFLGVGTGKIGSGIFHMLRFILEKVAVCPSKTTTGLHACMVVHSCNSKQMNSFKHLPIL